MALENRGVIPEQIWLNTHFGNRLHPIHKRLQIQHL